MTIRIAINGYGRIGRCLLRAIFESNQQDHLQVVAINDLGDLSVHAYLTQYDTVQGPFQGKVDVQDQNLIIDDKIIQVLSERDPEILPWEKLGIDVVLECSGQFSSQKKAMTHIRAGAKKVLISAPASDEVDATVVYGVNHHILNDTHQIISNASCTTNCLAPMAKILHETVGIESGLMNTIHAYTNDQVLTDSYHTDVRRARSATQSMIPTKTGAAAAIGLVLPELAGKLDGFSLRVPVINVSVVDLTFVAKQGVDVNQINKAFIEASEKSLKGVLAINQQPLVSSDFNHHPASCIVDVTQTKVIGQLVKVLAWYDNEWGFSNRMLDVLTAWSRTWTG
jgi:glyceraldehyde 3-phosphate dehydrogenase